MKEKIVSINIVRVVREAYEAKPMYVVNIISNMCSNMSPGRFFYTLPEAMGWVSMFCENKV